MHDIKTIGVITRVTNLAYTRNNKKHAWNS